MKKFKYVTIITLTVLFIAFLGNTFYLLSLYDSIKQQYINTARDCLMEADFLEITKRLKRIYEYNDSNLILNISIVHDKRLTKEGEIVPAENDIQEDSLSYNEKNLFSMFDALQTTMACNLRSQMPEQDRNGTDFKLLKSIFKNELNNAGLYPESVRVIYGDSVPSFPTKDMWQIDYSLYNNTPVIYKAFITPPIGGILKQTTGVIITTSIIFITLCFLFGYLVRTVLRLRTLEEMKDDFTNNMTHELKTPIAASYSAIDSLLNYGDHYDRDKRNRYLNIALDQLNRLSGLVENILSLSMERRRSIVIEHVDIDVKPFIDEIASIHKLKTDKEINITVKVSPENLVIKTDPTHFANILNNLLDNAIKYSAGTVQIDIEVDKDRLVISDNGIGIPSKALPNIFNKFYRVPNGNCPEVRGYGIGLYYVKSILEKMNWSIMARSIIGKGTTFIINFDDYEK